MSHLAYSGRNNFALTFKESPKKASRTTQANNPEAGEYVSIRMLDDKRYTEASTRSLSFLRVSFWPAFPSWMIFG
jgi:hypothetical protein